MIRNIRYWLRWIFRPSQRPVKGCGDGRYCQPYRQHRPCTHCKKPTCSRRMKVDEQTLRRYYVPWCLDCTWRIFIPDPADSAVRQERARDDWQRELPDQYPSFTRTTIKTFLESEDEELILGPNTVAISAINSSLASLGFTECYAEQRSNLAVLRRVPERNPDDRRQGLHHRRGAGQPGQSQGDLH